MDHSHKRRSFLHRHSLSLTALGIVLLLIGLYTRSNHVTHLGSFYGNAIADWTGVFVTILMTKYLYEKGSRESRQPRGFLPSKTLELLREHSLTLVLFITGAGWVLAFRAMDPNSKWGQVVGNIVSEWTQILGLVLMTKRLIEVNPRHSQHSKMAASLDASQSDPQRT
jgi:hypothetical protein